MNHASWIRVLGAALLLAGGGGCNDDGSGGGSAPIVNPAKFVAGVDNPYFPLTPGTMMAYEAMTPDGLERSENYVTFQTKVILGVTCIVVLAREWLDGDLIEETFDWYAQDVDGNVWYFGEASKEIDMGVVVSTAGSWEAGRNGARPGIIMLGDPQVGMIYAQENAPGVAEDRGEVLALGVTVNIPFGKFTNCLKTKETNPLDPGVEEFKYYAPGVGLVLVEEPDFDVELVEIAP